MKLIDYMSMTKSAFWKLVDAEGPAAEKAITQLWEELDERIPSRAEAIEGLNNLFLASHLRIKRDGRTLAKYYPTRQFTKNRLSKVDDLYWVDHFTAGISSMSTLNWFSSAKLKKKKNGQMGYAGASTHFVLGFHGLPFHIVPLMHGSWHEPRRNRDGISIEMVNAGGLHRKDGDWYYWARKLPMALVQELPPVLLDKPYRGNKVMQPFTKDQIINNIKLKRLVVAALNGSKETEQRLEHCRMSQHTDWRKGKSDMGVLWPYDECNDAAYAPEPIPELSFIQSYDDFLDEEGAIWDELSHKWEGDDESENPSYGNSTPTHDKDDDPDDDEVFSTERVQELLVKKGYTVKIDGKPGPQTRKTVMKFQAEWNKTKKPKLKVDGIAGPQTCECLVK